MVSQVMTMKQLFSAATFSLLFLTANSSWSDHHSKDSIHLTNGATDEIFGIRPAIGGVLGWLSDKGSKIFTSALNFSGIKPFVTKFGSSNLRMLAEMLESSNATLSLESLSWLTSTIYNYFLGKSIGWSTQFSEEDLPKLSDEMAEYANNVANAMVATMVSRGWIKPKAVKEAEVKLAKVLRSMADQFSREEITQTPGEG